MDDFSKLLKLWATRLKAEQQRIVENRTTESADEWRFAQGQIHAFNKLLRALDSPKTELYGLLNESPEGALEGS